MAAGEALACINDSTMTWGNLQSLLQLAIGLNGAYFTFRQALSPNYTSRHMIEEELTAIRRDPIIIGTPLIHRSVSNSIRLFTSFRASIKYIYKWIDYFMPYGYSIAIIFTVLLIYSSTNFNEQVSFIEVFLICSFGFALIIVCIVVEFVLLLRFMRITRLAGDILLIAKREILKSLTPRGASYAS